MQIPYSWVWSFTGRAPFGITREAHEMDYGFLCNAYGDILQSDYFKIRNDRLQWTTTSWLCILFLHIQISEQKVADQYRVIISNILDHELRGQRSKRFTTSHAIKRKYWSSRLNKSCKSSTCENFRIKTYRATLTSFIMNC